MKLLEKILVPVDVNTDSREQINAAKKVAFKYKSVIILLYVVPDDDLKDETKGLIKRFVAAMLNEIKDSLTREEISVIEPVIAFGNPLDKIIQIANSENVNLILTGSNSRKKRSKFKLGVTAEQLVRMSEVPVWVVKTKEKTILNNILCPIDFSKPSERALNNAILLARQFEATLGILTVYEPLIHVSKRINVDLDEENASRLDKVHRKMEFFIRKFDLDGVNYKAEVRSGVIHENILNAIKKQGFDLLIMGTNGRTGLSRFFMGSITEKVIREMPCSIITVKEKDIIQLKIDNEIREIELHFHNGNELVKNAFYQDAIIEFQKCLQINDMHIPSMYRLAKIFDKLGDVNKSEFYMKMTKEILSKIWDRKIEEEIRRNYHL